MTRTRQPKITTIALSHEVSRYRSLVVDVPFSHVSKGYAMTRPWLCPDGFAQVSIFDRSGWLYHVPSGKMLWRFKELELGIEVIDWLDYYVPEFALFTSVAKNCSRYDLERATAWLYWRHRAEKALDLWMQYKHNERPGLTIYSRPRRRAA